MNDYARALPMSRKEFKRLGDGEVAYIKQLNIELARKLFPAIGEKLEGIDLYAVLGGRIQKRRDYCAETSVHPPVSAQVAEIASAIAKLAEVHSP